MYELNRLFSTSNRRRFLKQLAAGATGFALGSTIRRRDSHALFGSDKSRVSLVPGKDQRETAYRSLLPFRGEIGKAVGDRQVVIKANAGVGSEKARTRGAWPPPGSSEKSNAVCQPMHAGSSPMSDRAVIRGRRPAAPAPMITTSYFTLYYPHNVEGENRDSHP